jgi:hypothetical protein
MKITLESTNYTPKITASVESSADDLTPEQAYEELFKPVLMAYGFSEKTVDKLRE